MGAMGEAIAAFAQPLIDATDGSTEQLNKALSISLVCYNLALLPGDEWEAKLREQQPALGLNDEEFEVFQRSVVGPMVRRHREMFPLLHRRQREMFPQLEREPFRRPERDSFLLAAEGHTSSEPPTTTADRAERHVVIDRYAPCPCQSGKKYKFCCGAKRQRH